MNGLLDRFSTREGLSRLALGLAAISLVGFVLAFAFNWPSDFVLDESSVDDKVTAFDFFNGTVTSIPLIPWLVLIIGGLLVRRRGTASVVAAAVLGLVGVAITLGGGGEIFSDNPNVPKFVLVLAGVFFLVAGLLLVVSAVQVLRSRGRAAD